MTYHCGMRVFIFCLIMSFISGHAIAQQDQLEHYYGRSKDAFADKDYSTFLFYTLKADSIRPNHPALHYNLALAYSLTGAYEKGCRQLRAILNYNPAFNIESDSNLMPLYNHCNMQEMKQWLTNKNKPLQTSLLFTTLETKGMHPESIDFIAHNKLIFGDVRNRSLSIYEGGKTSSIMDYHADPDLYAVMGVRYDLANERIWFCTSAIPEMIDYSDSLSGHSSIWAVSTTGDILYKQKLSGQNTFGEIILRNDGSVLISDAQSNKIYSASIGEDLSVYLDVSHMVLNLQGIALDPDEKVLYFADYLSGLYKRDLSTGETTKISLHEDISEKGFDGIYLVHDDLLAIQNGAKPNKLLRLSLNSDHTAVITHKIVDQNIEILDEPTQGIVFEGQFYYLANSPWPYYNKQDLLLPENYKPAILRYHY